MCESAYGYTLANQGEGINPLTKASPSLAQLELTSPIQESELNYLGLVLNPSAEIPGVKPGNECGTASGGSLTNKQSAELRGRSLPREKGASNFSPGGSTKATFTLAQIKAEVLVLEVVTVYCSYCQGEVSKLNGFYALLQNTPYAGKIKVIGVSMSNSGQDVKYFQQKYNVPFPLFADPQNGIYKVLGRIQTPYWIVLKSDDQGGFTEIYSQSKELLEPKALLDLILEKSRLK